jgi:cell division protein FtsB
MSSARRPPSRRPSRARALTSGARPYVVLLVLVVVLVAGMGVGPLQRFTAAADRVSELQSTRDALREQVDRLEDRRARLSDPEELELIARSELGLVKPGEIPFIVASPDDPGTEQVRPEPPESPAAEGGPWYRRLGRALSNLFEPAQ